MLSTTPPREIMTTHPHQVNPYTWLQFFDPAAALQSVVDHAETLGSSRRARHTIRVYLSSLADFFAFAGCTVIRREMRQDIILAGDASEMDHYTFHFHRMQMPGKQLVQEYCAARRRDGLSATSLKRYLSAIRHFIRALDEQPVSPSTGADLLLIMEMQRQFRQAANMKNPASEFTTNRPALENHGQRLELNEVNLLFESFTPVLDTLAGKRDLALLYSGITTGLRAAELERITLNSIRQGPDCYEVRVLGKRGNIDPVGMDSTAYRLITEFVAAWNARLDDGDPRRITGDTPIWQPLMKNDEIPAIGYHSYQPEKGIRARALSHIVVRRTEEAFGKDKSISAHDMRRTCAYLMRAHGFSWEQIQAQLRHKSIATTQKYVGKVKNLAQSLPSTRIEFFVPLALAA